MTQKNLLRSAIALTGFALLSACSKPESKSSTPSPTPTPTTPIAASGTIIYNGKTYTALSINSYGKYNEKSYSLEVDCSTADSNIFLTISSANYLPATASIGIVNNIMPLASGKVSWVLSITNKTTFAYYQESSLIDKSGNMDITNASNELQFVANKSQGYKLDASAGGLLSFNIKRTNPTIPSANAAFTAPTGMDANNITIGSSVTWNHTADRHQINAYKGKCKAFVQNASASTKELVFIFKDGLPVSGTYDIVSNEASVTDGKVFVKYTSLSPLSVYSSTNGGQVTVVNTSGEVKIYAKNVSLNNGTANDNLNAFITF